MHGPSAAAGATVATSFVDEIANGDVWIAQDAIRKGLVDRLVTSDEYIWERIQAGDRVLKIQQFDRSKALAFGINPLFSLLGAKRSSGGIVRDNGDDSVPWLRAEAVISRLITNILPKVTSVAAVATVVWKHFLFERRFEM